MAPTEKNKAPDSRLRTILIVNDSAYIRRMIRFSLNPDRFRVIEASNEKDALACVATQPAELLIVDSEFLGMDEFRLVRELRLRPESEYLPIIMLSNELGATQRQQARQVGVSAILEKPFLPDQVCGLVEGIFA